MSGAPLLLVAAPLRLTYWVLVVATAVIVFLFGVILARHLERAGAARRRETVARELEPMFARFLAAGDRARLEDELRASMRRMDAAHRPVAAVMIIDLMREATSRAQTDAVRQALVESGIVQLGEMGTHRLSPWRRALACELLGKIGAQRSVPTLLARLDDRRPEMRTAAVRALGDVRSAEAVPALSKMFLQRRGVPTNVVADALRRIGGEDVGPVFERGVASTDPIVRVASCYGLAASASTHGAAVFRLAEVLASDQDTRVRAAAASSLGIAGGGNAPPALIDAIADRDIGVRRAAVKALGRFDDPTTAEALDERTEDEDREVAIRAAEALLALALRPRAASEASTRLSASSAWSVEYARTVAEVSA